MLTVEQIKLMSYSKSQKFVAEAMLYPEKFGSGAPYENETDYRLEQWMTYLCFINLGKNQ